MLTDITPPLATPDNDVQIRLATPQDETPILQLARLGHRPWERGYALVAELDGVAVAAIALTTGSVVFNPGHPTTEALEQLRLRRFRLLNQS